MRKLLLGFMFCGVILILSADSYASTSCPENPAPNEVLLFTEQNFQGECTSYIGFNREIKHHKSKVSSVKVGSGINVTLYKLRRFRGKRASTYKPEMPVFNAKAVNWRSLRISKKAAPVVSVPKPCSGNKPNPDVEAAAEQVTIFTEPNFGGSCKTIDYKGRDQKPYPYSIPWNYKTKKDFWHDGTLRKRKATFNSMMVGSGVVVTVCSGSNLRGTCKDFTDTVVDLTGEGIAYNSISSFKIYTLNPKDYKNPMLPNDSQVTICAGRVFNSGCRKLNVGNYDLRGRTYQYIHVGANAKAQAYSDRSFFGNFEVYNGGSKQAATSQIKSIRVMSSSDQIAELKPRPTPAPTPVSTSSPTVDNSPVAQANRESIFIVNGSGTKCLTVKGGSVKNYTPVTLENCSDSDSQKWTFTSDNRIRGLANMCLTNNSGLALVTCQSLGSQNWVVSDKNELKRAAACLSEAKLKNGSPSVTDCNGRSEQRWRFEKSVSVPKPNTSRTNSGNRNSSANIPVVMPAGGSFLKRTNLSLSRSPMISAFLYEETRSATPRPAGPSSVSRSPIRINYFDFALNRTGELFYTKSNDFYSFRNDFRDRIRKVDYSSPSKLVKIIGTDLSPARQNRRLTYITNLYALTADGKLVIASFAAGSDTLPRSISFRSSPQQIRFRDAIFQTSWERMLVLTNNSRLLQYKDKKWTELAKTDFIKIATNDYEAKIFGLNAKNELFALDENGKNAKKILDNVKDFSTEQNTIYFISSETNLLMKAGLNGKSIEKADEKGTFVKVIANKGCVVQNGNGQTFTCQ